MNIKEHNGEVSPELMDLLLSADPDEVLVRSYLTQAKTMVSCDGERIVGVAVLTNSEGVYELKNIAVAQDHQGKGIAKSLIAEVKELAKELGAIELEVGTGNSSLSQLALYQKCGFRISHIEPDFFASYPEPIFENGIRCIDMVRLRAPL